MLILKKNMYNVIHFNSHYINTALDNESIDQNLLNITNKSKSNPLPWNGQFSPQLVDILLCYYSKQTDIIFDPFAGSGTTLLESGELNKEAYGTELNFAAVCLSKIYEFINFDLSYRTVLLNDFSEMLNQRGILYSETLFSKYFPDNTISMSERIKNLATDDVNSKHKILRDCFIILVDLFKNNFSQEKLNNQWLRIRNLVLDLPVSDKKIKVFHQDARKTSLNHSSISFVLTSPPYINVINYHQQYRTSSEILNGSVLPFARAEIGSNRKNRSNRFHTVTQYCLDIALVLNELNRVCKDNTRIIFIVGRESFVRKTQFMNGEILSEIACECCNMKLLNRQERMFINRYGTKIYEDILHFNSTKKSNFDITNARKIAYDTLFSTVKYVLEDSKHDLISALQQIETIEPSPYILPTD